MARSWLLDRMREFGESTAIVWQDRATSYRELLEFIDGWNDEAFRAGQVVALDGDYSPQACALLLRLVENAAIVVPVASAAIVQRDTFFAAAEVQEVVTFDAADGWRRTSTGRQVEHPLLRQLAASGAPGLVLFTSGSTGASKAALHDVDRLLEKFRPPRQRLTTLNFLLFDHIGGVNTLFYTLANGGTVVTTRSRDPDVVCDLLERYRVELLPASPTFLNLLLMSDAHLRHDLSSLRLITYGTEVMPDGTLQRLHAAFPNVRLQQTYGLSELGILRSRSREAGSLWVQVGGEGTEWKVVDGTLRIRTEMAMLGYLNAPSPFDEDGWMDTQDVVEVDGDYLRILGRQSDIINVGGTKVYPAEVESVLMQMAGVSDATVYAVKNPILGQVVAADLQTTATVSDAELLRQVREFCRGKLDRYKIPVHVSVSTSASYNERFKKMRGRR